MRLSMRELKELFYRAVMEALGFNPDDYPENARPPVRLMYSTAGAPDWDADEDIVFIGITERGDDTSQPVHEYWKDKGEDLNRIHEVNRVLAVQFVAYGPNSYDNLTFLKHQMADGSSVLRKAEIFYIPSADVPNYAPEYFGGLWYERADLTLTFNNVMVFDEEIKTIKVVPVKVIEDKTGQDAGSGGNGHEESWKVDETGIFIKENE